MKKIIFFFIILISILNVSAQIIKGVVKNSDSAVISNASVTLLQSNNLKIIKIEITNSNGEFAFKNIQPGLYQIQISNIGYKKYTSSNLDITQSNLIELPVFYLQKISGSLNEVVVKSVKPLIEVKADKMVVNVEGTINATGTDVLELIRKSPSIAVDKDDNIMMSGKNGVQVYIDGKPSPLNGEDLSNYLRSIQSSQVEAIELITNPSAKYEAAGNAGIINIKLKKNKTIGTNGTVTIGYAIGVYSKYNTGFSINHRNKKINVFANYNINKAVNTVDFNINRKLLDTLFNLHSDRKANNTAQGFKAGIDYFANKKSTFGFLINGNLSRIDPVAYTKNTIIYAPTNDTNKILISNNTQTGISNNINFNGNYKLTGAHQNSLNIDADYGFFTLNRNLYQPNTYFNKDQTIEINQKIYRLISISKIDIYSFKIDYEQPVAKGSIGYGIKSSYVKSNNNFEVYNILSNVSSLDTTKSNQFNYKEYINAGYINYNRNFKTAQLQIGLRVENTQSNGKSFAINSDRVVNYNSNIEFSRSYTNLFPNIAISFSKSKNFQWAINAGRRVDRPNYQDLNPFEFRIDEYSFRKGNVDLLPQFSNNISVTNTFKDKLISKLSYSYINNLIGQIVDTVDGSKNFISPKNIAQQKLLGLFESYQFKKKWYATFITANLFYTKFNANLGGTNRIINTEMASAIIGIQNSFKLKNNINAEINATYNSPSVNGTFVNDARWGVDAGLQKNILNGLANIKLSATDIFWTNNDKGSSSFTGQSGNFYFKRETHQYKINFTYRFGNSYIKTARSRNIGSEEEIKRSQNGGN